MKYVFLEKAKKENHSFLIWDTGLNVEHARKIAEAGNKVYYYVEWLSEAPKYFRYAIGKGFDGIFKIKKFFNFYDKVDWIGFLELGRGDFCNDLRKKGYRVFGAGKGERLESDRVFAKQIQKEVGLPVQHFKVIYGIDNVLKYVEKSPEKYVKLSNFRGDLESFFAKDRSSAEMILKPFSLAVGPFESASQFMVEDKIDGVVETGWDLFFNGTKFLKPYLWGYLSENFYVGKFTNSMPAVLKEVMDKIRPILIGFNYRGAISVEVIVTKDGKPYVLDWTCRFANPLSDLYPRAIKNYIDVLWNVAEGNDIDIVPAAEYVGIDWFTSESNEFQWVKVSFPEKFADMISVQGAAKVGEEIFAAPTGAGRYTIAISSYGNLLTSIITKIDKVAEEVDVYDMEPFPMNRTKIGEIIKKGKTVGLNF